ncbi:MAG: glycosyltransferase family 39 protein [Methanobacteriales archaeon]|nr:glycosyltransferase family 39 protein [Methanobacteriales archaeon]
MNTKGSYPEKLRALTGQYIFWLVIITLMVTFYVLSVQVRIGVPYWDVFNYLNNALYFAGLEGAGAGTISLSPLVPFLTSLFFRLGLVSTTVIMALDALLFIAGVIGLFYLLKTRFSEILSFTGGVFYLSLAVLFPWIASGGIDVPAVSISIWAVYFLVKGTRNRPRLLYLVAPTLVLAVLTRYTAGLVVMPLLLYYLLQDRHRNNLTGLSVGLLATLILAAPLLWYFYTRMGSLDVIWNLLVSTATISPSAVDDVAYNPHPWFYLMNLPNYISLAPFQGTYSVLLNPSRGYPSPLAYLALLLGGSGILVYLYRLLKSQGTGLTFSRAFFSKSLIFLVLLATLLLTFNHTSYLFSVALVLVLCYLAGTFIRVNKNEYLALDLLFLAWFLSYLIFHSLLPIKVDRYFITMAPALVYFLILGWSELLATLSTWKPGLNSRWIYLALALVLLGSTTITYAGHTPQKVFVVYLEDAGNWITQQDPQYRDQVLASDYSSALSWYLKKDVKGAFPRLYRTPQDFAVYLQSQDVDYYVDSLSNPKPDLPGYQPVANFRMVTVYRRIYDS